MGRTVGRGRCWGDFKACYVLQGHDDGALISDLPDEEAITTFLLSTGSAGNVRTTTLRAFPEDVFLNHIAAL